MTPANDNIPAFDSRYEVRPSPTEINTLLHRRFEGMGPPSKAQLDAAVLRVFNKTMTRWRGTDGKWRPCFDGYRAPRGEAAPAEPSAERHLRIIGVGAYPCLKVRNSGISEGTEHDRIMTARRAQRVLTWLDDRPKRVDGTITRLPAGIAWQVDFIGLQMAPKATATRACFVNPGAFEDALISSIDAATRGDVHAAVARALMPERRRNRPRRRAASPGRHSMAA